MTKADTICLPAGTWVYCTVHGCEGFSRVVAVRPRDGYIRITGVNVWCPPHNFERRDP